MRVLISDYKEQMEADYSLTIHKLKELLPDCKVVVEPYGTKTFFEELEKADGMITAFLPVEEALLLKAPKLKCISQNSAGYSNVDLKAMEKHSVALCHIREYCTREVAEHAISLILALNHNLKKYDESVQRNVWSYQIAPAERTINHKTLAIFGFGKIGRQTASLAQALGMQVLAVDPYVSKEDAAQCKVTLCDNEEALKKADIIINHMALTEENYHYFNRENFIKMQNHPIFINVGRGGCVEEDALLEALEQEQISAAGLDVLEEENPDLSKCSLKNRDNVILTPHAAFYSKDSIESLHKISASNLAWYLLGKPENCDEIVKR